MNTLNKNKKVDNYFIRKNNTIIELDSISDTDNIKLNPSNILVENINYGDNDIIIINTHYFNKPEPFISVIDLKDVGVWNIKYKTNTQIS